MNEDFRILKKTVEALVMYRVDMGLGVDMGQLKKGLWNLYKGLFSNGPKPIWLSKGKNKIRLGQTHSTCVPSKKWILNQVELATFERASMSTTVKVMLEDQ